MIRHIRLHICALLLLLMPCALHAATPQLQATQGDVVRVETDASSAKLRLWCFGKQWPTKQQADGHWRGWIGVDMKQKPQPYPVEWSDGKRVVARATLTVRKGNFRISRITVSKQMAVFDKATLHRIRSEVKALKATYTTPVDAEPAMIIRHRPIEGIESTPFGAQRFVNGEPRAPHSGIDIAAPAGTPILTPLAGKVLMVKAMYLNGNTVVIGHGNGLVSVFSHMRRTMVHTGDWVTADQQIGEVGATGRATGPHLHWGMRFNNARINPASLMATAASTPTHN